MENKKVQFIEYILSVLKNTESFMVEQTPIFVQEYLTYWFWTHILIGIIVFILSSFVLFAFKDSVSDRDWKEDKLWFIFVYLLFNSITIYSIWRAIEIWIAPKVYLFNSFSEFLK